MSATITGSMSSADRVDAPLFRAEMTSPACPVIDVHVNLGISDASGLSYGRLQPGDYLARMRQAGIGHACAFPPLMSRYVAANAKLREWAGSTDGRILPFARLGGVYGPRPIRAFWQARKALRARVFPPPVDEVDLERYAGVKMIPHMSGVPDRQTLARISELCLPVLVHSGTHVPPSWIEHALVRYLRGPVILAHLGAYPTDAALLTQAIELTRAHDNVYLDTSGIWLSEFLRYAAARVPARLLFGSDAPLTDPLVAWRHLASAITDDRILERISWQNAATLLGLSAPG